MKSLLPLVSRVQNVSNVKLSESLATNPTENLLKKFILRTAGVVALFLFLGGSVWGQNGIVGDGFTNGWGTGDIISFDQGAGTTRIKTLNPRGTGNQFFRLVRNWSGDLNQFGPVGCVDVDWTNPGVIYGAITCNTSGAFFINCPNTTDNYVFKTPNGNSSTDLLYFRVQGAVRSVSSVSQSPSAAAVAPNMPVTVTANLDGSLSTGQAVYLRYTTDAWGSSTVVQMSGSGTSYTAQIPGGSATNVRSYYVFTSGTANVAPNGSNADLYTINLNNNAGSNYSYNVAAATNVVTVTASGGTGSALYTTLKGAFDAINAGTHTGAIIVNINGNTTEGTTPATLNSSGAGSASYTSVLIRPTADAVSVSGNPVTGFGVIQLNGADNVTINGDNPNTSGTNRNLTVSNTATTAVIANSVIRIATSAAVTSADNNTISNCILLGNVTAGNISSITNATSSSNSSFGIYCGGNGGATATGAPTAITSVTSVTAPSGTTINGLTINNNAISQCARAIVFNGAAATVAVGTTTITNNTIGASGTQSGNPPYTTPSTTVYTKGIWLNGLTTATITGNTVQNLMSYVATPITGLEFVGAIGAGNHTITGNTFTNVVNNNSSTSSGVVCALLGSGSGTFNFSSNTLSGIWSVSTSVIGVSYANSATSGTIALNNISTIRSRTTGGQFARGISVSSGNAVTIQNNFIWDVLNIGSTSFSNSFNACGILLSGGINHKVYHNSVNLFGASTSTGSNSINCLALGANTQTGIDIRNNIFSNTVTGGASTDAHTCVFLPFAASATMLMTLNNNAYYSGAGAQNGIAYIGSTSFSAANLLTAANFNAGATTPATNLRSFTSACGVSTSDNASFAATTAAPFTSNTNLKINTSLSGVSALYTTGASSTGVTTDIEGDTRLSTPCIGADEFILPVSCTTPTSPSNGATGVSQTTTLSWAAATNASSYDVYFGTDNPPTNIVNSANQTSTTYTPSSSLSPLTQYFWRIVPKNAGSTASGCATWSFTTQAAVPTLSTTLTSIAFGTQCINSNTTNTFSINAVNLTGSSVTISAPANFTVSEDNSTFASTITVNHTSGSFTNKTIYVKFSPTGVSAYSGNVVINGAGLAADVNVAVTGTGAGLSGTYTVGYGGNYATLTAAVAAYNSTCLLGPVVFSLTDATYSTNETFPITINANSTASATNTLTIRPASGLTPTITGSSTLAIIRLNGADFVTIDGSNSGGSDKSLTIENTNTGATSAVVWIASASSSDGADNNTIKNIIAKGNASTTTLSAIISSSGTTIGSAAEAANTNLTISNNTCIKSQYGIGVVGNAGYQTGTVISDNLIGSNTLADYIGYRGIFIANVNSALVSNNSISNIIVSSAINVSGIEVGAGVINGSITSNNITTIKSTSTFGYGAYGINFGSATGTTGVLVSNNMISGIETANYSTSSTQWNAFGIRIAAAIPSLKIYNNTINLFGSVTSGASAGMSSCLITTTAVTGLDLRNNIFSNTQTFGASGSFAYNLYLTSGTTFTDINFNNYYGTSGTNTTYNLGYNGTATNSNLTSWATFTTKDAQSLAVIPTFTSTTDLHLNTGSNCNLDGAGTPIATVTTDIDGTTRNATTPDIGADEFTAVLPTITLGSNPQVCAGATSANLTYSATTGSPNRYNLNFNTAAETVGFTDVGYTSLASSPIVITVPVTAAPGTYIGTLKVRNLATGCTSSGNTVNVVINPIPTVTVNSPSTCQGTSTAVTATPGDANTYSYAWTVPSGETNPGNVASFSATVAGTYGVVITNNSTNCVSSSASGNLSYIAAVSISTQPALQVVLPNTTASFNVVASGAGLSYQWQVNDNINGWTDISGATSDTYSITATESMNNYLYRCVVSGTCGSVNSNSASLTVSSTSIITHPQNQSICESAGVATFSIAISGTEPSYQWEEFTSSWAPISNGGIYSGATSNTLTLTGITSSQNGYLYRCVLSGSIVSNSASLSVSIPSVAGTASSTQGICQGSSPAAITLVGNTGSIQWEVSSDNIFFSNISSANTSTLSSAAMGSLNATRYYRAAVTNGVCSSVNSNVVTITVTPTPNAGTLSGTTSVCVNATTSFTSNGNSGAAWSSSNNAVATVNSLGVITGISAGTATITYTVTGTGGCANATATRTVTVNANPAITSATASPATVCAGSTVSLSAASVLVNAGTASIGAGAFTGSGTGASVFPGSWGGTKTQILYNASELISAGITAGNITSVGFEPTSSGQTYQGFYVYVKTTSASVLSTTFESLGTLVYVGTLANEGFVPIANVVNTLNFGTGSGTASTFDWDGTSNLIVTFSWSRVPSASTATSSSMKYDLVSYNCTTYKQADSQTPAAMRDQTTGTVSTSRPRITFGGQVGTNNAANYTWSWNATPTVSTATGTTTAVNNTSSATTETYTVTATQASTGCSSTATTSAVTINPTPATPTANGTSICGPQNATCSVTGTGISGNTFNWYTVPTGGTAISGQTAATLSAYPISTTTSLYASEANANCESARVEVIQTVTTPTSVTASASSATVCAGTSTTLSATSANTGYTYSWNNSGGSGASVTVSPSATTTYTVTATDASGGASNGCSTTATTTVTVNPVPTTLSITPSTASICTGSTQSLVASGGNSPSTGVAILGTATTLTGATEQPTAFCNRWPSYRMQTVFTASELQAIGLSAGNITSMAFNIATLGDASTNSGFIIKIANTNLSVLSGDFVSTTSGFTTVYPSQTYTHTATGWQTIPFSTPFNWDGISNIIVDLIHNGADATNNSTTYFTATTGNTVAYTLTASTNTASFSNKRLNVTFGGQVLSPSPVTWSPTTALYTDAAATIAYTGTAATTVYAKPTTTTTYTATATATTGCTSSSTTAITVSPTSVAGSVSAASSTLCSGTGTTLSLTGNTGTIQWQNSSDNVTFANISGQTASTVNTGNLTQTRYYKAVVTSGACSSVTSGVVTVTVNTPIYSYTNTGLWDASSNWNLSCDNGATYSVATSEPTTPSIAYVNNGQTVTATALTIATGNQVIVKNGGKLTVTGVLTNNGTLKVESGGSLLQTLGSTQSGTGTYIAEREMSGTGSDTPTGRFWYTGVPMTGAYSTSFLAGGPNKLWSHNEATGSYTEITDDATTLIQTKGYVFRGVNNTTSNNNTYSFSSNNIGNGDVVFNLTRTANSSKPGFNLVANPYPSHLSWNALYATTLVGAASPLLPTVWYRSMNASNVMTFDTYNYDGGIGTNNSGTTVTGFIAPFQSFWVRVAPGSTAATMTATNAMRSHGTQNFLTLTPATVRLNLSNGVSHDETIVFVKEDLSNDYDYRDSDKEIPSATVHQIYSLEGTKKVVINGIANAIEKDTLQLGVQIPTAGTYSINCSELTFSDLVYLEDKLTEAYIQLDNTSTYSFTSEAGTFNNRFVLHFAPVPALPGQTAATAIAMSTSNWPQCNNVSTEDQWHSFTAGTEAVSIAVNTTTSDITIELQDGTGNVVAQENAVNGIGNETLNFYGLTAGQTYKVGVRNTNSNEPAGTYGICVKTLKRGGCDYGAGPYSLCQYYKATWAGSTGVSYTFTFTGTSGPAAGQTFTRTQNSDICVLSTVTPLLPYGSTYDVTISNTYTLTDGSGNTEQITVPSNAGCQVITTVQPQTTLSASSSCNNGPRFRGAVVSSMPWVCGANNWRWRFTEVNPLTLQAVGLPIELNRGAASNFLSLGTVNQLQNGKTYAVQTAPLFTYTASNYQWGPIQYLCIVGAAQSALQDPSEDASQEVSQGSTKDVAQDAAQELNTMVYVTEGNHLNIQLTNTESNTAKRADIYDVTGKLVKSVRLVEGMNTVAIDDASGIYMVRTTVGEKVETQRVFLKK